jgi:hypothetical protein
VSRDPPRNSPTQATLPMEVTLFVINKLVG